MAATMTCRARSGGRDHHGSSSLSGSISPSGFASSSSSAFASSPAVRFSSQPSAFLHRSASPTRVSLGGASSLAPSFLFAVTSSSDHHKHHRPPQQPVKRPVVGCGGGRRRTCLCSPTTHPGSFRCSLHKGFGGQAAVSSSSRLNARRSAMTNSLVRIGAVEGEWVRRALATLIRPTSHQQRRRDAFQPRPSRLSTMSKAGDDDRR
ncbi:hypothetical protein Cni_G22297 [Canna indica]|uniref:Serine-rich protein-like protein n=1 Tax=Canna indica TaxID=4628 RepID=A0AAQ3KR25_9LILI|nr:hypothetical protein Cni_G22297 [Canna indica]